MRRQPYGEESSSGVWQGGEGSSSSARPAVIGFDWQDSVAQPPWSPHPLQDLPQLPSFPHPQGSSFDQHGVEAGISHLAGTVIDGLTWQEHAPPVDVTGSVANVPGVESRWNQQDDSRVPQALQAPVLTHKKWEDKM